ncbi:hypothetical protein ACLOAV_008287 [Pseudogymnoascus australis]
MCIFSSLSKSSNSDSDMHPPPDYSNNFTSTNHLQIQAIGYDVNQALTSRTLENIFVFRPKSSEVVYASMRLKKNSNSCALVRASDPHATLISTIYRFGPMRHPRMRILPPNSVVSVEEAIKNDNVRGELVEVKSRSMVSRGQVFDTSLGKFEWRYGTREEQAACNADSLLVMDRVDGKSKSGSRIAQLIRNAEFRTPGTRQYSGGNGGRLMMDLRMWNDDSPERAEAFVVAIDKEGKFWWFGEYKLEDQVKGGSVSVYSSEDLVTWDHHGLALQPILDHPYISPENITQRPNVVYSEELDKYEVSSQSPPIRAVIAITPSFSSPPSVIRLPSSTRTVIFTCTVIISPFLNLRPTSDTIGGPYTFVDATAPLENWSQDFGIFTDYKDGRFYSCFSNGDRKEYRDVYITPFNETVTGLEEVVHRFISDVVAFRADSLSGPWSQLFTVVPLNTRTYNSQSGFSLKIKGMKATTYLYLGDQAKYKPVKGKENRGIHAKTTAKAFKQEANFASDRVILTGISGNDGTVTFKGLK